MVYADQGDTTGKGERLPEAEANQQRADQSRSYRGRNTIKVAEADLRSRYASWTTGQIASM